MDSAAEVCEWMTNQAVYDVAWSEARFGLELHTYADPAGN